MVSVYRQKIERSQVNNTPQQTNRIYVVDCSGSMYGVMDMMKEQIKNKIPQLTNTGDTVSIVWFSSKGESGILLEGVEVNSITDFNKINTSIDKWLRALYLTGYIEPIQHVNNIIDRLSVKYPSGAFSTLFFTDGYENQATRKSLIEAIKKTKSDSFMFVEFGWNCDHDLLVSMAEACGGTVIFNESFEDYTETFDNFMEKQAIASKRISVELEKAAKYGYVFHTSPDEILTYVVENGQVVIPEHLDHITYITDEDIDNAESLTEIYAAIYTTAQKTLGSETFELLSRTGDVRFVEEFTNCFSKQDYLEFQKNIKEAVYDLNMRDIKGIDFNCVPSADAYTVLDLLSELCSKGNKFHPYDPEFTYERIGAKRAQKTNLTEAEKLQLQEDMKDAMANGDSASIIQLADKLSEASKAIKEYKFVPSGNNPGYDTELVFNSSRPNVSLRFVSPGTVHIGKNDFGLPEDFPTRITRNYSVVKDGIKHSSLLCLPFSLTEKSHVKLLIEGVIADPVYQKGKIFYINAKSLPVINRNMFIDVSANDFFASHVNKLYLQAEQKVYNAYMKNDFPYVSEGFAALYSTEAAQFLADIGITEKNGFSPKTVSVKPTDKYIAKEVNVKIAKCSNIPAINEKLVDKIEAGKSLTLAESLVAPTVSAVTVARNNAAASGDVNLYEPWLIDQRQHTSENLKNNNLAIAKYVFILTLSKTWFKEFSSMDENTMIINRDGKDFNCSVEVKDIEIEI
jgi:von Willebrand factor type A domain